MNKIINNDQLSRFNLLSQKVIEQNASFNELQELKELLNTLNNLVELDLPQAIINFNNYARSANIAL